MIVSSQKVAKAYRATAFHSFDSFTPKYSLPRGNAPISEKFPQEKSFGELLKRELQRAHFKL